MKWYWPSRNPLTEFFGASTLLTRSSFNAIFLSFLMLQVLGPFFIWSLNVQVSQRYVLDTLLTGLYSRWFHLYTRLQQSPKKLKLWNSSATQRKLCTSVSNYQLTFLFGSLKVTSNSTCSKPHPLSPEQTWSELCFLLWWTEPLSIQFSMLETYVSS